MAADSLPDLLCRLDAWLPELTEELTSFAERQQKEDPEMRPWELFLDELHFRRMLCCAQHARNRADAEIIRRCTALRIDLANLRTSLRLLGRRLSAQEVQSLYLSGGSIGWKPFAAMMRADAIEQIHRHLPRGPLTAALDLGLLSFVNTGWPSVFERLFDEQRIRLKKTLARGYPVSVAVPLYFMVRAYNELVNLRTIARGIRYRIPAGKVRENLVYA
jgi:vacuolar-type H+-ATPase subunit C/Vma6